jgi:hypothetical protein
MSNLTPNNQPTETTRPDPNRSASPARSGRGRSRASTLAMIGVATAALASVSILGAAGMAGALTTGPAVYEQQDLNQSVPITVGNVHTTVVKSPVLKPGNYLVNLIIDVGNDQTGATVLCGDATTTNFDVVDGNYGVLDNQGTTAPVSGTCEVTSTVQITQASDHVIGWATVYSGPGGATAQGWSMNETAIGTLNVKH